MGVLSFELSVSWRYFQQIFSYKSTCLITPCDPELAPCVTLFASEFAAPPRHTSKPPQPHF